MSGLRTVTVNVGNHNYVVRRDAYHETAQLVIGLPLTTLSAYHAELSERYLGEHLIGASYAKRKVEDNVRNVNITSQPAGTMLHAVSMNPELRKSKCIFR